VTLAYATAVTASIPSLDLDLDVKDCTITLDETRAPYVEATVSIPLPVEAEMETIDPRDNLRVQIEAEVDWVSPADPTQTRTFDLVLHARTIDHAADRVVLQCYSDESLLIDGGYVDDEVDVTTRALTTLRGVVNEIIGGGRVPELGATTLEAGAADADTTITRDRVNLCPNPGCENASPAWGLTAGTGASAFARSTAVTPYAGTYSTRFTAAAGNANVRATPDNAGGYFTVEPGKTYRWAFYLRSSVSRVAHAWLRFYSGVGTGVLLDEISIDPFPTSTGAWMLFEISATAPAGATTVAPLVLTEGNSAGQFHYLDGMLFHEWTDGERPDWEPPVGGVPYFDGANNPDPTHYTVAWDGTANQSTSTLTRLDDRDPAGLDIEPGDLWWDYLSPLVRANDLRLWSDEARDWWLTEAGDTIAGTVTIAASENALGGQDQISYQATGDDGTPLYFTAVIVRYRWMVDGIQHTRYDVAGIGAGQGRKVLRVDIDRPWPGAGRAAAILATAQGRGRTQELDAVMNLDATPGMALSTDLPSTPEQIGVVSAVTWRWSDGPSHGTMTVRARDLVEAP
jgi:hypothetical protein